MTGPHDNESHKNMLIRWFGPNRNTHWTIAGSVAVILLGGYLVLSNRDGNPTSTAISATETSRLNGTGTAKIREIGRRAHVPREWRRAETSFS